MSSFISSILLLMWVSLKSRDRSPVMHTFAMLFLFLIVRTEHSRSFAISFDMFASMLFVPQWITTCLIAGGNSRFSAHHGKFLTLPPHIPQLNVSNCITNSIPLFYTFSIPLYTSEQAKAMIIHVIFVNINLEFEHLI